MDELNEFLSDLNHLAVKARSIHMDFMPRLERIITQAHEDLGNSSEIQSVIDQLSYASGVMNATVALYNSLRENAVQARITLQQSTKKKAVA